MKKLVLVMLAAFGLSGCLVATVVTGTVGAAVGVVDAVTPDIVD